MDTARATNLDEAARQTLQELQAAGLRRSLRIVGQPRGTHLELAGREVVNFSSNDYLGLATSADLKAVMQEGVERFGVGSGASRLVCGNHQPHELLESTLADFKGTAAALAFSSGYATAVGVIPSVVGPGDIIILDKLSHASLIDAAKLSGATIRVFPHNHLGKLERLLAGAREKNVASTRVLVVTESIFSMDGDAAPLAEIVALKERHGAWLLVDEAHGVGVLGPQGRGYLAALGLEKRVELQMGTLSKALGVSGGYVTASREVCDLLINKARSLIYSTAPPPAVALTAHRAVELVRSSHGDALRARLLANKDLLSRLLAAGATTPKERRLQSPVDATPDFPPLPAAIQPLIIGNETEAVQASAALLEAGYLIPAIRYPTVARGQARLRLTLSAAHEAGEIEGLVACLHHLMPQLRLGAHDPGGEDA